MSQSSRSQRTNLPEAAGLNYGGIVGLWTWTIEVSIVYPSKAVAARWNGALEARMRRAPLEAFLRRQSLRSVPVSPFRDSDNIARAAVMMVQAGLELYFHQREDGLAIRQRAVVAHIACLICLALARQMSEPDLWRNAGQVSSAKILSFWIGLNSAAMVATAVARDFQKTLELGVSPSDWRISQGALDAVRWNDAGSMTRAARNIAARLDAEPPSMLRAVAEYRSQPG